MTCFFSCFFFLNVLDFWLSVLLFANVKRFREVLKKKTQIMHLLWIGGGSSKVDKQWVGGVAAGG